MFALKKTKNNSGFSVIELMVSAGIIAIISAMVVVNLRGSTQKSSLDNEAERLASVIRQAHINALIGLTVSGSRPLGGFGLRLSQCSSDCSYTLFADDGDYVYGAGDTLIEDLGLLDDNIYISLLAPDDPLDIVFVPPAGDIYLNGDVVADSAAITLGFESTAYTKRVILNRLSGRLDIQ